MPMPDWWVIVLGLFAFWFVIDMGSRIYLIWAPWEDYKEDQTESDSLKYREEKEAEAVEILSKYRIGRWLLGQRDK